MQRDTDLRTLTMRVEAILYLKAQPLTLSELATLAATAPEAVELALIELLNDYAHRQTALKLSKLTIDTACNSSPPFKNWFSPLSPLNWGLRHSAH